MSRARRLEALVRIRDLQERVAEADELARRRDAERRRSEVERSRNALDALGSVGGLVSFGEFAHRRTAIDAGLHDVERRGELLEAAAKVHAEARQAWFDAHLRHDAIERIHDRVAEEEAAEAARLEQVELDDLVTTRHARRSGRRPELDHEVTR